MEGGEARERVLDVAERMFAERGYSAVKLRDIAGGVGIKHTSLYHHAPGGKEELFVEVTERHLARHRVGLETAIAGAGTDLRAALYGVAMWLLSQPPMDLVRMAQSDLPAIAPAHAQRLTAASYASLLAPIERALVAAHERGEIASHQFAMVAGGILGMVESLFAIPTRLTKPILEAMARDVIDIFLDGLYVK